MDAVLVNNKWGEELPVRKEWAEPIQQTVYFIENQPDSVEVYTGQETAWLNVFTRKYNSIRNQQWWGYMADGILTDLTKSPPEFVVLTRYKSTSNFKLFGKS